MTDGIIKYKDECIDIDSLRPLSEFLIKDFPLIVENLARNSKVLLDKNNDLFFRKKNLFLEMEESYKANITMIEE